MEWTSIPFSFWFYFGRIHSSIACQNVPYCLLICLNQTYNENESNQESTTSALRCIQSIGRSLTCWIFMKIATFFHSAKPQILNQIISIIWINGCKSMTKYACISSVFVFLMEWNCIASNWFVLEYFLSNGLYAKPQLNRTKMEIFKECILCTQ